MRFDDWARSRLAGLLRFAMVLTCDRGLAEDTVQEVLLKAHRRWDRIQAADSPEAYVRRMIVNEYLTWRRKWSRFIPSEELGEQSAVQTSVADHAERHADRDLLIAGLAKLPPRQRAVIALRFYEDLSDAQIAETLSCRPGTVRSQLSRALAKLRVDLGDDPNPATHPTGANNAH